MGARALRQAVALIACAAGAGVAAAGLPAMARAGATPANTTLATAARRPPAAEPLVAILCYHDLSPDPRTDLQTVSPQFLRQQILASKQAGFTFLPLSELLARRARGEALPPRVMVLTFDDGYRSFRELALPVLRDEGVKATLAIITSFVDHPPASLPPLMSWDEIREVERSGLVEIASHTHDLHRYETDNPARDTAPSVSVRRYLPAETRYENREEYRARIRTDLTASQRELTARLGHPATTLVWPYGMHNEMARGLAAQAGFTTTLALGWREARPADFDIACLPRVMVTKSLRFAGGSLSWLRAPEGVRRVARLRLDDLYDGDPGRFRTQLDQAILRLRAIGATHVLLDGCANPLGDGRLRQTYFPSFQTTMRADLWSLVAAKLLNARMRVWVLAPSMNLTWAWEKHPGWRLGADPHPLAASAYGVANDVFEARVARQWPTRLSPELPAVRAAAVDFFTDLAVYLPVDAVVFDDDATLLPGERLASNPAAGPGERAAAIDSLIGAIEGGVRAWRPECRFARVTGSGAVLSTGPDRETAHDFGHMLEADDFTIVRADPADTGFLRDPARWITVVGRRANDRWRAGANARAAAAARAGLPRPVPGTPAPVLLELPVDGTAGGGTPPASRLPALLALARRSGFESFVVGPVTPANQDAIPARALEAGAAAR